MNKVVLIGRLTKSPTLTRTTSGKSVVKFILAVNRRMKTEGQPDADFISCTAWGKTAETMQQYLNKGSRIAVDGRIQTGQYQGKDGNMIYTTEVIVESFDFLDNKKEESNDSGSYVNDVHQEDMLVNADLPF